MAPRSRAGRQHCGERWAAPSPREALITVKWEASWGTDLLAALRSVCSRRRAKERQTPAPFLGLHSKGCKQILPNQLFQICKERRESVRLFLWLRLVFIRVLLSGFNTLANGLWKELGPCVRPGWHTVCVAAALSSPSHPPWCQQAVLGGASQPAADLGSPGRCQRAAGKMWLCMGALLSLCAPWERCCWASLVAVMWFEQR